MAGFYKPFTTKLLNIPIIVYPCLGIEKVLEREENTIQKHLEHLYISNTELLEIGQYQIIILWDENSDDKNEISSDIMTDVWIFDKIDTWGSGPLVDVKIFRNYTLETKIGVSAGDGLLLLGREEELRRKSNSLQDYLNGTRAVLPTDIQPKEDFV